jgi:hypothetical protein
MKLEDRIGSEVADLSLSVSSNDAEIRANLHRSLSQLQDMVDNTVLALQSTMHDDIAAVTQVTNRMLERLGERLLAQSEEISGIHNTLSTLRAELNSFSLSGGAQSSMVEHSLASLEARLDRMVATSHAHSLSFDQKLVMIADRLQSHVQNLDNKITQSLAPVTERFHHRSKTLSAMVKLLEQTSKRSLISLNSSIVEVSDRVLGLEELVDLGMLALEERPEENNREDGGDSAELSASDSNAAVAVGGGDSNWHAAAGLRALSNFSARFVKFESRITSLGQRLDDMAQQAHENSLEACLIQCSEEVAFKQLNSAVKGIAAKMQALEQAR